MKKRGFTLMELLAVIIILALLLLLATVSVFGILETARKKAFVADVRGINKSASTEIRTKTTQSFF